MPAELSFVSSIYNLDAVGGILELLKYFSLHATNLMLCRAIITDDRVF